MDGYIHVGLSRNIDQAEYAFGFNPKVYPYIRTK